MPELPDIEAYLFALEQRILGQTLITVRLGTPFLLRSVAPPLKQADGQKVTGLRRVGKRIAIGLENDVWLVLHLMIAGRLHWKKAKPALGGRSNLAAFDFETGSLVLTEAGTQRRASLHVVSGEHGLVSLDPGGIDPLTCSKEEFAAALRRENHTLKRVLTDPQVFSGIGNAYSDEILHAAQLSPVLQSQKMTPAQIEGLHAATVETLRSWMERFRQEAAAGFPEKVTAFREGMAVHGRYGLPCPTCGTKIQRIRYASNETNYCPRCQTGGRLLADRALSRLLREDWPRSLEELESRSGKA